MSKIVLSLLVKNSTGVLSRIAGLFSRRGYNIDSLTVGETELDSISRMTVVARGDDAVLEQIEKQLRKQYDVINIRVLPADASVVRELIMVKVGATMETRSQLISICDIFRAKVVDVSEDSMIFELTGNQEKLNAFLNLLSGYKILEVARTGVTGLARGTADQK
ncbi:MAG: acetolactate synthase small subunit [Lachnospiraceae bacterium]|nr:acetolactate synthase small subunit [Lachnospiraceae bacterium]